MTQSLSNKFHGKEDEVVRAVQELGIDDAMLAYGLRSHKTFTDWLKGFTGDSWMALHPLEGLAGGEKAKLMREHRNTILDELEVFGFDWVMLAWGIKSKDTLERFISFDNQPFTKRLTPLQRAELNSKEALRLVREVKLQIETFLNRFAVIDAERRAERHAVIGLQGAYSSFTESVSNQLGQGMVRLFRAMLERGIKLDTLLPPAEKPDLSIGSLLAQGGKQQAQNDIVEATPENPLPEKVTNQLRQVYLLAHPMAQENK